MSAVRLLIVDDQSITRTGVRSLLAVQEGIEIVGEARDGGEAIEMAASLQPDVILMDLRMPGINGIEATRRIHRASPHIGILILTVFPGHSRRGPWLFAQEHGTRRTSEGDPYSSERGSNFQSGYCSKRTGLPYNA